MAKKLVKNDKKLFSVLLLLFAFGQIAVAAVTFLYAATTPALWTVMLPLSMLFWLFAWKCWQMRAVRIVTRTICAVVLGGLLLLLTVGMLIDIQSGGTVDPFTKQLTTSEWLLAYVAELCVFVQMALLLFLPIAAIASFGGQRADIRLLRIGGAALVVFAVVTAFVIPELIVKTFEIFGIGDVYFRAFYVVCTVGTVAATYARYPFGKKQLDRLVGAARERMHKKEEK